ncbi:MAG: two-component system sensor histidine kinase CreC [Gammaproteobacteria bacterium]
MTIRARIFLVFVLVVAAGFYFLVNWITDDLRPRYLESMEEPLIDSAQILAELLAPEFAQDRLDTERLKQAFERVYRRRFDALIYSLDKHGVDARVYVTDAKGIVLFDSLNRSVGQDFSRWNDVYRTLRGRYGARATYEDPRHPETAVLYIGAPIQVNGAIVGMVSLGKPAYNVERFLAMAKAKVIIAGALAAGVALLLGFGLYAWVSRPLQRLTRYAEAVRAGARVALPNLGRNEIGMMGAAMEAMRRELEGKDYVQRYVQTLTHELKSPLAAIRGAAELLEEDMPPAQRQRFLANIRTESERIQNLVERMLELAAVEKRQGLQNVEMVDLRELLREVTISLEPLLALRKVTVIDQSEAPSPIMGERFLLRQALANLLRNAVEFSPTGGAVSVNAHPHDGGMRLEITDHGPGIPDYALERVFERFYSLPRPDGGKGTGLGLSFAREVAELHGGRVELVNRADGGTRAILDLPARR